MSKKSIYVTPKNATSSEIINLTDLLFAYTSGENGTVIKISYENSSDSITFKSPEDCSACFKKIQELIGVVEI